MMNRSRSPRHLRTRTMVTLAIAVGMVTATAVGTTSIAEWSRTSEPPVIADRTPTPPALAPAKELRSGRDRAVTTDAESDGRIAAGLQYVPVNPYRTLDSREFGDNGDMFPDREVWFDVWTDAGGNPRIPSDIKAVSYNLTITDTLGAGGFLALYPADRLWPGNSSINWFGTGLDLANGGIVAVGNYDGPGEVAVYAGLVPDTATFFILDITGYFI
jgi:hypothetical protein